MSVPLSSAGPLRASAFIASPQAAGLGRRAVRGGAFTLASQAGKIVIMMASTAVLARQLARGDFGLVAMVTSATGLLLVMKDGGLSAATIQKAEVTEEQVSNLFWLNVALGLLFALLMVLLAPLIAWFYGDPRLRLIAVLLAGNFILSGIAAQHEALIRRALRFDALMGIDLASLSLGALAGILAACAYHSYFALVIGSVTTAASQCLLTCLFSRWRPGRPRRGAGIRSLLGFGGRYSLNSLVNTLAMSTDTILIGKFLGAEALGLYSRAYALLLQPTAQILGPMNAVALPTLSRLAGDAVRFKEAMGTILRLTSLASALACPVLLVGGDWLVRLFLGPGWEPAAGILRAFTITAFSMPISTAATWILTTRGRSRELLRWGLINSTLLVAAIACGLPWGGLGVALAYSLSGLFLRVPLLWWYLGRQGPLSFRELAGLIVPAFLLFLALTGSLLLFRQAIGPRAPIPGLLMLGLLHLALASAALCALPWGRDALRLASSLLQHLRPTDAIRPATP